MKRPYSATTLASAHYWSSRHRSGVLKSEVCGCFYCLATFKPLEVTKWIDDGGTALCPKCGIDSVIGSNSGFTIDTDFLGAMHSYWFATG